jgi:hypothetical protein
MEGIPMIRRSTCAVLILAIGATTCFADTVDHPWSSLTGARGTQVKVNLSDHSSLRGELRDTNDATITVDDRTLQKADVASVYAITKKARTKRIAISAAIGGGGGAIIGAAVGGCQPGGFCVINRGGAAAIFAGIGGIGGAIVGALTSVGSGNRLLYSAVPKR